MGSSLRKYWHLLLIAFAGAAAGLAVSRQMWPAGGSLADMSARVERLERRVDQIEAKIEARLTD